MNNPEKERELLAKLRTVDLYDWQEFNRYYQNEEYGDSILQVYRYLSGGFRPPTLEELEIHIDKLPDFCLKSYQLTNENVVLTASEQAILSIVAASQQGLEQN